MEKDNTRTNITIALSALGIIITVIISAVVATSSLERAIGANTAAIAELRGALYAHFTGHNHASAKAELDETEKPQP